MPTTTHFLAEDISVERLLKSVAYLWRVLYGEKDSKKPNGQHSISLRKNGNVCQRT